MSARTTVNPNDPRVRRTRLLLKQSLSELLAEKPFQEITIQDITERATVNRVTFYAHFEDKYDLISAWVRDGFVERLEAALPAKSPLTSSNLRTLCNVVFQTLGETRTRCRPLHQRYGPLFESAVQEALDVFILEWLRHWLVDLPFPGVSAESLASTMSWTIFGAGIDCSRSGENRSADGFVDEIVVVLLRGVSELFRQTDADRIVDQK